MKIGITGHTKGLGKAFADMFESQGHTVVGFSRANGYDITEKLDDIIEEVADFDMFINNAYAYWAQGELLKRLVARWEGTNKVIVNISSKMSLLTEPPAHVKDYAYNKAHQNYYLAKRHIVGSPQVLNVNLGLTDTDMAKPYTAKKMDPVDVVTMINDLLKYKDKIYVQELMIDVPGQDWKDL